MDGGLSGDGLLQVVVLGDNQMQTGVVGVEVVNGVVKSEEWEAARCSRTALLAVGMRD